MNNSTEEEVNVKSDNDANYSAHRDLFLKLLKETEVSKGDNASMMTKDDHDKILDIVLRDYRGNLPTREKTMLSKQKQFRSIYKWLKKYTVVTAGDHATLVFRRDLKIEDTDIPSALEEYQVISHADRVFDDILRFHKGDHPKGNCYVIYIFF